ESVHYIETAVLRLGSIIDALLRLSRAGRVQYQWQAVDLDATAGRVVAALHQTVADRGARVTVQPLPPAWGDPTALEQLFANLIGNALNYLDPARPGAVEVGADANPVTADGPPGAAGPVYFVRDNGRGIPAAYRAKV